MKTYKIKLLKKEQIAEQTFAYYFSKPTDFKFKAGDYGKFTLINPAKTDIKGNTRSFTFANTPDEKELVVVLRHRNTAFKQNLLNLPIGSELDLLAPIMMIQIKLNMNRPVVFLCGGVGVTVARSMILDALSSNFSEKIVLINTNRSVERTVYVDEFSKIANENKNFIYHLTLTGKIIPSDWKKDVGYINDEMIRKNIEGLAKPIFYITGPNRFIWGMYKLLKGLKINDSAINFDEFTGY